MVAARDAFARHLELLYACHACPNVAGLPITGAVRDTRVMLVGQAPGPHEAKHEKPFAYTAGKRLFGWFADSLGVPEEEFRERIYIAAVIRCFPGKDAKAGGDRVPDAEEIARCGEHLDREIAILGPDLVIAVGTLAASVMLSVGCGSQPHRGPAKSRPLHSLATTVGRLHRAERAGRKFDVVVLPHPSGRSTWLNKPENATLLRRSLELIRKHPAFQSSAKAEVLTTRRTRSGSGCRGRSR
ncbi:MAG TPA: uracil-DNA glycosylase family protein [Thermoanaerobaculia bacterium]|jgi:uracil-DNA glycosylase